ncbi:MAG: dTDP-4-dehydrorhamnose reductase, partial [Gammaproteobacteria bacterium]
WDVLLQGEAGVYHAACEGEATWFDLASETLRLCGDETPVDPCTTEEFPRPAPRPAYSVMACAKLTALRGRSLVSWQQALDDFLRAEGLVTT